MSEESIKKEHFYNIRRGVANPSVEIVKYQDDLFAKLGIYLDHELIMIKNKVAPEFISTKFRSQSILPFEFGFIGTCSLSLSYKSPPEIFGSIFFSFEGNRLYSPEAAQGFLDLNCEFGKDWTMDKWYMDEFDEFFPETWNWRPLPEDDTGTFSLKSMASQLGFQPNEIKEKPRKFPIWGQSGFALELEIVEEEDENVLCCKVYHGGVELVSQEGAFVKRIVLGEFS
jgi:hypothetical protein